MPAAVLARGAAPPTSPLRVLALAAHPGDAAFSAGATLATLVGRGHRVTLVTAFTGTIARPARVAVARRAIAGRADEMAARRREDVAAARHLGVHEVVHLGFLEAGGRGYPPPAVPTGPLREDDAVAIELREALDGLGTFDLALAPLGLGGHVDHRQLLRALGLPGRPDDPEPLDRPALGPLALWRDAPEAPDAPDALAGGDPPTPGDDAVVVSSDALRRKLAACACHATQLDRRFGGEDAMRDALCALAFADGARHGRPAPAERFVPAGPVVRALRAPLAARASSRR